MDGNSTSVLKWDLIGKILATCDSGSGSGNQEVPPSPPEPEDPTPKDTTKNKNFKYDTNLKKDICVVPNRSTC